LKAAGFPLAFPAFAQAAPITSNQCENDSPHQSVVRCSGENRKILHWLSALLAVFPRARCTFSAAINHQHCSTKQMGYSADCMEKVLLKLNADNVVQLIAMMGFVATLTISSRR